jgi:hypothetical protein
MDVGAHPGRESRYLRRLRAALIADLEPMITLTLRVAVMLAAGHRRRTEIAERVGATTREVDAAKRRLKRAAKRLDAGDAIGPRTPNDRF